MNDTDFGMAREQRRVDERVERLDCLERGLAMQIDGRGRMRVVLPRQADFVV